MKRPPWLRVTVSPRAARFLLAAGARPGPQEGTSTMIAGSDEWAERRQRIEAVKAAALMRDLVKREQSRHTYLVELCAHVCPLCGGCPGCCECDESGGRGEHGQ